VARSARAAGALDELGRAIEVITGRAPAAETLTRFAKYLDLLTTWNRTHHLTSYRTPHEVVRVQLVVKSTPPGADVLRAADGVRLGKTPFSRAFDRIDGEIELVVKLAGYRDARVTLPTTKDSEKAVRLVRLRAGTRPPDDRAPPEGTKPQGSGATVLDPYEDKPK